MYEEDTPGVKYSLYPASAATFRDFDGVVGAKEEKT